MIASAGRYGRRLPYPRYLDLDAYASRRLTAAASPPAARDRGRAPRRGRRPERSAAGRAAEDGAAAWRGFVDGDRAAIAVGQRMIVVLKQPVARRPHRRGRGHGDRVGDAPVDGRRRWPRRSRSRRGSRARASSSCRTSSTRARSTASRRRSTRRALALLERDRGRRRRLPGARRLPGRALGGRAERRRLRRRRRPARRGRHARASTDAGSRSRSSTPASTSRIRSSATGCSTGSTCSTPSGAAIARAHPDEPTRLERHGTQMAGLIVGQRRPGRDSRRRPGVAGSCRSASPAGSRAPRAASPSTAAPTSCSPGSSAPSIPTPTATSLDAARVALVGVAEPFAAFADGPIARAVAGAARLDTLVVVPAGNEGPAGPGYGSIGGPGGAPAALTVGAADLAQRHGDGSRRRAGGPARAARPRGAARRRRRAERAARADGRAPAPRRGERPARNAACALLRRRRATASSPAGRAARRARREPADAARSAVLAGAAAILVDGDRPGRRARPRRAPRRPGGRDPELGRGRAARGARARQRGRTSRSARPDGGTNERRAAIAPFSSHGPRLRRRDQARARRAGSRARHRRPGPERRPHRPLRDDQRHERCDRRGRRRRRGARAGAARARRGRAEGRARRHERPGDLAAPSPRRAPARSTRCAAAAAEVVARACHGRLRLRRQAGLDRRAQDRAAQRLFPARRRRRRRRDRGDRGPLGHRRARARATASPAPSAPVKLTARVAFLPRRVGAIQGRARLEVSGGGRVIVPWAVALPFKGSALIGRVGISARAFRASDRAPAVLTVQAGQVRDLAGRRQLRPVSRLDVELWRGGERLGPARAAAGRSPRAVRLRADRPRPARRRARRRAPTGCGVLAVPPDGTGRGRDRQVQDSLIREG